MLHGLDLIRKTPWKTTNRLSPHDPLILRNEQSCHYNIHLQSSRLVASEAWNTCLVHVKCLNVSTDDPTAALRLLTGMISNGRYKKDVRAY